MKATHKVAIMVSLIILASSLIGTADTVQYLTLAGRTDTNGTFLSAASHPVQTNQIVSLVGYDWSTTHNLTGNLHDGTLINITPYNQRAYGGSMFGSAQIPQIYTGMTNITVGGPGSATFQITTPSSRNVISNY